LPRLTQRQREARWQRERRQQTIIVVVFTVLLCSAIGLMLWAGTNRYYDANLKPAAMVDGHELPYRLYYHERDYELVKFYQDSGVPVGLENDPQLASQKRDYDGVAVNSLVEQVLLRRWPARSTTRSPTPTSAPATTTRSASSTRGTSS
jgi:hypothetical protein